MKPITIRLAIFRSFGREKTETVYHPPDFPVRLYYCNISKNRNKNESAIRFSLKNKQFRLNIKRQP